MTPDELSESIAAELRALAVERDVDAQAVSAIGSVTIERPKSREHGDWATNAALQFSKSFSMSPRELAEALADRVRRLTGIQAVDVAGPGFLNLTLDAAAAGELARTIVTAGEAFGQGDLHRGVRMNLEFVSANPTGPLHIGGTRWAAVGDSLARLLSMQGADVIREYYFNDHGAQIDRFANSLVAAFKGEPAPEDGYGGEYIKEIAAEVVAGTTADLTVMDDQNLREFFREHGVQLMFDQIKASLHEFGVDFDVYFHENSLHESGAVDRAVQRLREHGHVYEKDGALWLRSSDLGDEKDRVIVKSDGEPAYISGDLAYYLDKRERGFDRCIVMLGADHHGYVGRMMAMCSAFGDTPGENLEILIGQMVRLMRNGEPLRMSKRAGTVVTLEDLVDAVGVDAARYALTRSSTDTNIDIDLDVLSQQSNDNPVYYVQYAHARTQAIIRNAAQSGVDTSAFAPDLLTHTTESALLGALQDFPRVTRQAAELREPHRVARYLEELAGLFHRWYDSCRVIPQGDEDVSDLHRTRLWLATATGQVLRNGLKVLGVSAPERM